MDRVPISFGSSELVILGREREKKKKKKTLKLLIFGFQFSVLPAVTEILTDEIRTMPEWYRITRKTKQKANLA